MLKISPMDDASECRLVLEGKLIAPWADELRAACQRARANLHGRELVVDMKHVTIISKEGEDLLLQLMKQGVKFRARGVFTRLVFRQLSRRMEEHFQEAK